MINYELIYTIFANILNRLVESEEETNEENDNTIHTL